jgi:hypothetical protein
MLPMESSTDRSSINRDWSNNIKKYFPNARFSRDIYRQRVRQEFSVDENVRLPKEFSLD